MSKPPVHDLDAEAAVLSACMLKPGVVLDVSAVLKPEHFYAEGNRVIFEAICELQRSSSSVDTHTVCSLLRTRGRLVAAGGMKGVTAIVDETPAVDHVLDHARVVKALAMQRALVAIAHRIVSEGYVGHESVSKWIAGWHEEVSKTLEGSYTDDVGVSLGDAMRKAYSEMEARAQRDREDPGSAVRTGLDDVDRLLGSLEPGGLTVIAAKVHVGKSSFSRQVAMTVAATRRNSVLIWSGEQPDTECGKAMLHQDAGVPMIGELRTREEWAALADSASRLVDLPITINDNADIDPSRLRAKIRAHKAACARRGQPLRLVVVDYLQLLEGADLVERSANRARHLGAISKMLKAAAMGERVHIIAAAQLNDDGRISESSGPFKDADKVLYIHNEALVERASAYRQGATFKPPKSEPVDFEIKKARGGTLGKAQVLFLPAYGRFENYGG